jgi:hypothetical protein
VTVDLGAHRSQIEAALAHAGGTHTFEDIQAAVEAGSLQYWPGPRSAIVTEIIQYPRARALNFFLAGGELAELEAMYPLIEEWGRSQGCTVAVMSGRKGWERSFLTRKEGWEPKLVVFEKTLHG